MDVKKLKYLVAQANFHIKGISEREDGRPERTLKRVISLMTLQGTLSPRMLSENL